jgi:hypothetical protein
MPQTVCQKAAAVLLLPGDYGGVQLSKQNVKEELARKTSTPSDHTLDEIRGSESIQ